MNVLDVLRSNLVVAVGIEPTMPEATGLQSA